jgi:RimJ/RimL family protein N-acetyltransferase
MSVFGLWTWTLPLFRFDSYLNTALYSHSSGSEDGLDGRTKFISGKEPFGFHPKTGWYPVLHNHLSGEEETMRGTTVELVPLMLEHVSDFLRYSSDPTLWTWWLRQPPVDAATMRSEVETALAQQRSGQRLPFSIFHLAGKEHIGSTSFWDIDRVNRSVEIGSTWLASPFHKSGINRECKDLLLTHAFTELGMNRVVLQTDELNLRSRRAIEKLGARLDGVLREDKITWNGRRRSSAVYSILKSEWIPNRTPEPTRCARGSA